MKALLAVVAAELRAHRLALWAGLILGSTVAILSTLFGGANDLAPFVASTVNISLAIAIGLGGSIVSQDLSERRLGFYLARPLTPLAYWAGKMSAALLLALAAGAMCLLPPLVLGSFVGVAPGVPMWSAAAKALTQSWVPYLVVVWFLAAGGVLGGASRTRSPILIVDILMLPILVVLFLRAIGDTWRLGTTEIVMQHALPYAIAAATLVLLGAGAAQVSLGRLDLSRGHLWLSAIAWSGLLACIGAVTLYSRSVADLSPSQLRMPHGVSLRAPLSGDHVMLEGLADRWNVRPGPFGGSRFYAGFLLDAQGRAVRMAGLEGLTGVAWSPDGRHFVWSKDSMTGDPSNTYSGPPLLREFPGFGPSLWVVSLDGSDARPRRVPRAEAAEAARALSPSGRRLLVTTARGKGILDVLTGETLASLADAADWSSPRFLSETLVRALRVGPSGQSRIVEWDAAGDRLNERGAIAGQSTSSGGARWPTTLTPTDDYERVLRFDAAGLFLHDLDGRATATLVNGWTTPHRVAGLVSGDRVACIESDAEGLRLRVFAPDGRPLSESRIAGRLLRVGGESAPGLLALGLAPNREPDRRESAFVDLATGRVTRREPGLLPGLRRWQAYQGPGPNILVRGEAPQDQNQNPAPASLATRLFLSDEGVLLLDPASGDKRVIVRRRDRED